jgi:hypothetical protein
MAQITIAALITEPPPSGLGYCCEWFFFSRYRQTALIAARLGVTPRAVRYHKEAWRACECSCEGKANCLRKRIS